MTESNLELLEHMLDEFCAKTTPDLKRVDFLNMLVRAYGEVTSFNEEIQHHHTAPELRGMSLMTESMLENLITNFQTYWTSENDETTFS